MERSLFFLKVQNLQNAGCPRRQHNMIPIQYPAILDEAIIQKEPEPGVSEVPVIILTHRIQEQQINTAIARIEALPSIKGRITRIRTDSPLSHLAD